MSSQNISLERKTREMEGEKRGEREGDQRERERQNRKGGKKEGGVDAPLLKNLRWAMLIQTHLSVGAVKQVQLIPEVIYVKITLIFRTSGHHILHSNGQVPQ